MKLFNKIVSTVLAIIATTSVWAQPVPCPLTVAAGPDTTLSCSSCVTLTATQTNPLHSTTTYTVSPTTYLPYAFNAGAAILNNIDDHYSAVLNLTFPFCFFGTFNTQCVVGANGNICFNLNLANGPENWPISGPLPGSNSNGTLNSIMGAYYDMDPSIGSTSEIRYATYGTAPCRTFVVSWYHLPMFSCNAQLCTQQIVLYESTNAIDVFIQDKPSCPTWNGDRAILGIENAAGTTFYTAPGYNGTVWTATNLAYRFEPATPVTTVFTWYNAAGVQIGTGPTVNVCPTATTTYTVKAVSTADCDSLIATGTATITVNTPYVPDFTYTVQHACLNNTVNFSNTSTGSVAVDTSYWDFGDGTNLTLTGGNSMSSPAPHVYPVNGTFNVRLIVAGGSCRDTVYHLLNFVHTPVVASLTTNVDSICLGNPINFTSTSTGGGLTYVWHFGDNGNGVGSNTSHTYTNSGVYQAELIVTDSVGCKDSAFKQLVIGEAPFVNAGPDFITCIHDSVKINASYSPSNPGFTFTWTPTTGINNPALLNPTVSPLANTQYILTVTDNTSGNLCSRSDTVNITVLMGHTLFNQDTTICLGQSVNINASSSSGLYSYSWAPVAGVSLTNILTPVITPDTTTTYYLIGSYPGCHDSVSHVTITVQPNPTAFAGYDREICEWDTAHIHAFVSPSWFSGYHYSWSPTNILAGNPGDTSDVIFIGLHDSDIIVSVTSSAGCSDIDTMHMTVWPGNFADLLPKKDIDVCPGSSIPLQITGSGFRFYWTPGIYLDDSTIATPICTPVTNVSYTVLVTDIHGCKDTLGIRATVRPSAVVNLKDSVEIFPGETATLSPEGNCLYFSWTPNIGLSADNTSNPVASPDYTTWYHLQGTTEYGCIGTDSILAIVHPASVVGVPNVFVPGTGPNGILRLQKRGTSALKTFVIFNRWGNKVFETTNIDEGWDGKFNGEPQPLGVYIYLLEGYTGEGQFYSKQGNITLIR